MLERNGFLSTNYTVDAIRLETRNRLLRLFIKKVGKSIVAGKSSVSFTRPKDVADIHLDHAVGQYRAAGFDVQTLTEGKRVKIVVSWWPKESLPD